MLAKIVARGSCLSSHNILSKRNISHKAGFQVTLCGAGGNIGQPLSLLLKQCPSIRQLVLHDNNVSGQAEDLSHIDTSTKVKFINGEHNLDIALWGSDVVIVAAGMPPSSASPFGSILFSKNVLVMLKIASAIADTCPNAMIGVLTTPVNSIVPMFAEVLKMSGAYNPNRMFGISPSVCRANSLIAEMQGLNVSNVNCPVIGGDFKNTTVPIISQCIPTVSLSSVELYKLTRKIQEGGMTVSNATSGVKFPVLSMAYAGAKFTYNILRAMAGDKDIVEYAFVQSEIPHLKYFLSPILLGRHGIEKNFGIPKLSTFEFELIREALPELKKNIQEGEEFVSSV